ncbi:MAG TPA: ribokinase [Myxococcota bacterium]|nr:ribokinase [Myxococcota bacterium]
MRDIAVVGSMNVDVSLRVPRFVAPGETLRATGLELGAGGKGLNQAIAAARLGGRVRMIGRVGADPFAEIALGALRDAGVDVSYVESLVGERTGLAAITVDESTGQNQIAVAGGANKRVSVEHVRDAVSAFRAAGVLLIQLELPAETVDAALELARANHVRTVLDPAPVRELSDATLARVDVLTPNEGEAEKLSGVRIHGVESAAAAGAVLQQKTRGDVVVTLGAAGCVWVHATGFEHVPAPRVRAVDTTGAGDAFNGALAVALARGEPITRALREAVRAGSASTLRRGASAAMPTAADLLALPELS